MAEAEETVGVEQAREAVAGGDAKALDIRDEEEWSGAHVPGAIHIPAEKLESGIDDLDLDSEQRLVVFASDRAPGRRRSRHCAKRALRRRWSRAALRSGAPRTSGCSRRRTRTRRTSAARTGAPGSYRRGLAPDLRRDVGRVEIDAGAAKRRPLVLEQATLALPLRKLAVGSDDAVPGDVIGVGRGQHRTGEARCAWGELTVGGDQSGRYGADPLEDLAGALGVHLAQAVASLPSST